MISLQSDSLKYQLERVSSPDVSEEELIRLTRSSHLEVLLRLATRDSLPDAVVMESVRVWERFAFPAFGRLMRNETLSSEAYAFLSQAVPGCIIDSLLFNPKISGAQWLSIVSRFKSEKSSVKCLSCNVGKVSVDDIDAFYQELKTAEVPYYKTLYTVGKVMLKVEGVPSSSAVRILEILEQESKFGEIMSYCVVNDYLTEETAEWFFTRKLAMEEQRQSNRNSMIGLIGSASFSPKLLFTAEALSSRQVRESLAILLSGSYNQDFIDRVYSHISGADDHEMIPEDWKKRVIISSYIGAGVLI